MQIRSMTSAGPDRTTPSRHRIEIKLSPEQKDLIARGARARGLGISEFVRLAAAAAAKAALRKP